MSYPGGKGGDGVYQALINLMPPHRTYIEPFLGGGAIMRHKKPAFMSIGIDCDLFVTAEWKDHGIPGLIVETDDSLNYLRSAGRFDRHTLIYCDPPYPLSTLKSGRGRYRHMMSDANHRKLLEYLQRLRCMVMVSSYPNPMYAEALNGWNTLTYSAPTRGGGAATEQVWFNFPKPTVLHDWRFVGSNYREREKFKRRFKTWTRRLSLMTELERQAMMFALSEANRSTPPLTATMVDDASAQPDSD